MIKSRNIFFLFVFSLTVCFSVRGNNIEKGFEALQEYNYFEAKRIFLKTIKKDSSAAGFGLATIFFRNDNPFHSLDSAHKFISISERNFKNISTKSKEILARFNIDYLSVLDLRAKISLEYFKIALKINTEDGYQEFILKNQWANERFLAIHKRDSIVFDLAKKKNTASDINAFMMKYPESEYILDAQKVFDLCQYKEYTYDGKIDSYVSFCKEYPRSRYVKDAEDKIYELYTVNKSILEYVDFVKNYPNNRNIENAWRKIYQLYMIDYSEDIIQKFKEDFPNYPFKSELELDIEYAKRQMLPFKDSLLFGCIDFDGNVLIEPIYDYVGFFYEGLAVAVRNGKYGYIDKGNNVIIDFKYDSGADFEAGRAIVGLNEKSGIIDRAGHVILPIEFEDIGTFSEGFIYGEKDSLYGYYDNSGFQRLEEKYTEAFSFSSGLAKVQINNNQSYIDIYGGVVVPPLYKSIRFFNDSLLVFEKDSKFGICKKNGEIIDSAYFDFIGVLLNDRAIITKNGKLGYINGAGKIILEIKFDQFPNFIDAGQFNGFYAVVKSKGKFGVIDNLGKFIIPPTYSQLGKFSSLLAFQKANLWGFIDLNNKPIIAPQFDYAESFMDGFSIVEKNQLLGVINSQNVITVPILYTDISRIDKNRLIVVNNDKKGVMTLNGEELVPVEYDQIRLFNKDLLILSKGSEVHYLNLPLKKVIKPIVK